ncbi:MFS general substrate transporter [Lizonia empirigonia]|nr:MFS general substrate transporter [Lizonia empirigonia]
MLYRRPSISENGNSRNSHELPRFSFEGDDRPLVSTERLFRQWSEDEETGHDPDPGFNAIGHITWDGPNDPANPLNWSQSRKWVVTMLVSMFTFISPFSSTMVTPALPVIAEDFDIPEGFMRQLVMTIFLLGYAQGPFAPLSEIYGRVTVLQYANLIYLVFNTACGFAQTKEQMLAFRFLSGVGGAAPQALCNGVLADTWRKEERGKGQAIYGMLTWISPCVAPICGAYISQGVSWRWIFWATSIFTVLVQVTTLFFLRETFAPAILAKKAKHIRKALKSIRKDVVVRPEYETGDRFSKILRKRLVLPFIMMFTHPATQAPSVYRAYLYGVMYLMLSTFPLVFEELYARLKTYYGLEEGLPKFRVPPMLIAGILCPIDLFIYSWTAQAKVHWIAPNIGCVIVAIGMIIAVGAFMRTMCGFSFPLFAVQMYETLGLGWGNSLLAFLTLGLALVSPVLWFCGPKLRAMSTRGLL